MSLFKRKNKMPISEAVVERNRQIIELYDEYGSVLAVAYKMQLPENVIKGILRGYFGIKRVK